MNSYIVQTLLVSTLASCSCHEIRYTNTEMLEANMFIACKENICLGQLYVLLVSAGFGIHVLERFPEFEKFEQILRILVCSMLLIRRIAEDLQCCWRVQLRAELFATCFNKIGCRICATVAWRRGNDHRKMA